MDDAKGQLERRVLVLMPTERDAERTAQLLQSEAKLPVTLCCDMSMLCSELTHGAGAVLITDEGLRKDANKQLEDTLRAQPAWSSVPVLVIAQEAAQNKLRRVSLPEHVNFTIIDRPVRTATLLSVVVSALHARRNQYKIRSAMEERERTAVELADQDERLRFALSAGKLGSWELNLASGVMTCSDLCKENFGRPSSEPFSYEALHAAILDEDRARVQAAIADSLASASLYDVEYRVRYPNGEIHWVMVRGRALYDGAGRPTRMIGVSLDITERRRLLESLEASEAKLASQAEQLISADRSKDEFLATLAHELRNPMAPLSTGLTLLSHSPDPRTTERTLGVMQRQVRHMVRLIDDLLDVSRITRGKLVLKREPCALAPIVQQAVEGSLPNVERAGHTLRVTSSPEPLYVDADPTRIAQAVSNLLNNAAKYTPNGGLIEVVVRRDGPNAAISITDNGLGIPADRLDDVFRMFSQVNHALERSQGGLGIGLALVRRLAEMHGGTVVAQSEGHLRGSTFTLRLPTIAAREQSPSVVSQYPPPLAGQHVLVVDDNEDAAELLVMMLEQWGYRTSIAHDGEEAISAAGDDVPDIIVLDIGLPGMSGYEVARRLRADTRFDRSGLIALTGWGTAEDKLKASRAGFDEHLTKPVDAADLQRAIARATKLRLARPAAS